MKVITSGTTTQNAPRHQPISAKTPPSVGPSSVATVQVMLLVVSTCGRSRASNKVPISA